MKTENNLIMSDKNLLKRLKQRIKWDMRVSNLDVLLKVQNGEVTVFGYFDKPYRHEAAINTIKTTDGVARLYDQSQVLHDYKRTDIDIEALLAKQILGIPLRQKEWIDVSVNNGVVKLEGIVSKAEHKASAARATWELSGVKDCHNQIQLKNLKANELRLHQNPYPFSNIIYRTMLI